MSQLKLKRIVTISAVVLAVGVSLASTTMAKPGYLAQAKKLGFAAQNCKYCHTKASGGSGWNARGNWLREEKGRRGAKDVDVSWLREYKGD